MRLIPHLTALFANRHGNFSVSTALLLLPLLGMVGLGLDLTHAMQVKSQIAEAADAAVLDSISDASSAYVISSSIKPDEIIRLAEERARLFFYAQLEGKSLTDGPIEFTPRVDLVGHDLVTTATYRARVESSFLRALNIPGFSFSGTVSARSDTLPFSQVHILVDNSPSMGTGATPAARASLAMITRNSCVMSCHAVGEANSSVDLARRAKIPIRIDVVRDAVAGLAKVVEENRSVQNQFTMNLYSFGLTTAEHYLRFVRPVATGLTNMDLFREAAQKIDLMFNMSPSEYPRASFFHDVFPAIGALIPPSGSGATASSPQQVLIFISDGVADGDRFFTCQRPVNDRRCQEPVDVKDCEALKRKGIRIATIYTHYYLTPTDTISMRVVGLFLPLVPNAMRKCASPGLYAELNETSDTEAVMRSIFLKAVSAPRLTQ